MQLCRPANGRGKPDMGPNLAHELGPGLSHAVPGSSVSLCASYALGGWKGTTRASRSDLQQTHTRSNHTRLVTREIK